MSQKKINVIVYSDYICPFCYIGFHRIEKLKEQFDLEVEWRPFELHPETPKEGFWMDENNISLPKDYLEMVIANVKKLADEDGLEIKFSGKLPNSQLSLYIAEFMKKKGKFDEFHKLVFEKYFKYGEDIGDQSLLLDLVESLGVNRNEVLEYIKSDEPANLLRKASFELGRYGINGVPTFFIGNKFIVGAQPYEVFEDVIRQVSSVYVEKAES